MKQLITALHKGQGAKKLVFVHGNMASAKWWRPVMAALDQEYEMLAVNLRGFGDSPDTPEQVTLADHANDIYELTRKYRFEQLVLVGHSLGSGIAMQFAADYPELLTGLVLVDSTPVAGMQGIDYNLLQMVVNNKELAMTSLKATLIKALDQGFLSELLEDGVRALPSVIPNTRALDGADFSAEAPDFAKPVLVVHGALDALVPVAEAEKAVQIYPNAILKIIPDVGHNPQVEDPMAFVTVLRNFVNKL
jgi:branched-chain amino acid transport system permease protein